MKLMIHADGCDEPLDADGLCPKCKFHPDMQSTRFKEFTDEQFRTFKSEGRTLMGVGRERL